jgi:hypothetical protein
MIDEPRRKVSFLVVSDSLTARELAEAIGGEPDEGSSGSPRFPLQATWELHASGRGSDDLSALIENVMLRLQPSARAIIALRGTDQSLTCLLRIVQYIGDDPVGPGFAIEREVVALLATLGAFIDVDQYFAPA